MQAESFKSLYEMDRLSVMGLVEPLKRLPELLRIRRNIVRRYSNNRPAVFIGIDSPDFNSGIEQRLHRAGVKTVHYVSPSVWAWRQGRIKKIKKSVDLMLTLLPFEADFYRQHQVPVCFVGHPLLSSLAASQIKIQPVPSLASTPSDQCCVLCPAADPAKLSYWRICFSTLLRLSVRRGTQIFS